VNRAAGRGDDIHTELARYLDEAIATVRRVLVTVLEEMETP
jgi:hypothetical protein